MTRRMAYIPPAETDVPNSSCYLVWLPDDSRYRAAFWGAYSDLAQYWLWDEEDDTRREEITQSWLAAIAQTLECADMSCLDEILAELAAIRAAIAANACCGDYTLISATYNTVITPGVGDPPTTWGDGETVVDWEDWEELVCGSASDFVDRLIAVAVAARETLLAGTLAINAVTAWLRHVTFLSLVFDIANTLANTVWGEILATGADSWNNVAANLEAARDDIICAIVQGGDVEQIVGDAVGTVAWGAFYAFVDYDTAIALMYEGGADGQYLGVMREACPTCSGVPDEDLYLAIYNNNYGSLLSGPGVGPANPLQYYTPYVFQSSSINVSGCTAQRLRFTIMDSDGVTLRNVGMTISISGHANAPSCATNNQAYWNADNSSTVVRTYTQAPNQGDIGDRHVLYVYGAAASQFTMTVTFRPEA